MASTAASRLDVSIVSVSRCVSVGSLTVLGSQTRSPELGGRCGFSRHVRNSALTPNTPE